MHKLIADATWQIQSGSNIGSGFSFIRDDIIVTNHHVIEPSQINPTIPILGRTENGIEVALELLKFSPKDQSDWAVLRIIGKLHSGRNVLTPDSSPNYERGQHIIFSGFPHGIPHLLTQEAQISGKIDDKKFYINGIVNDGNSGGPIINAETGKIIGIVTQRRFVGNFQLQKTLNEIRQLQNHCKQLMQGTCGVVIMGINFADFANLISSSLDVVSQVITANANTGIGIGFSTDEIVDEIKTI